MGIDDTPSIHYAADGNARSFVGRDAVEVFRAAALSSALGLLAAGITPTRGLTIKRALAMCKVYTGRDYKRSEIAQARIDLNVWVQTMKSAIPSTQESPR